MSIAILATGDELIQGDTLNTTSQALAHTLSAAGLPVGLHLACGDTEQQIHECLAFLAQHHDIIILTGGLGPTSDDRTRFALARFLQLTLVEFPAAIAHIQARLARANVGMNDGNRQQAFFPEQAVLLANPAGTAMGCYLSAQQKMFILLPGPPRECLPMFKEQVLPLLELTRHNDKQLLKWRLFGVAEGQIAQILDDALSAIDCETGYRLDTPYVEFKVRCQDSDVDEVMQIIDPLVAPHIIASPEQKASERLRALIKDLAEPMVIIDDATGGALQILLQQPENYMKLSFQHRPNVDLQFHLSGLKEYWSQHADAAVTSLTIKYQNNKGQGSETHQIPYRSPLVVDYAAEWLSFRLLHLIDQLHE